MTQNFPGTNSAALTIIVGGCKPIRRRQDSESSIDGVRHFYGLRSVVSLAAEMEKQYQGKRIISLLSFDKRRFFTQGPRDPRPRGEMGKS